MPHVLSAFARWRWVGWFLDRFVSLLLRSGLLVQKYYADVFIVAEKVS